VQKKKLQERLEELEKKNNDMVDKYERELEMFNQVNKLNHSVDLTFPSNNLSTYS
jgi:hypothetical protein